LAGGTYAILKDNGPQTLLLVELGVGDGGVLLQVGTNLLAPASNRLIEKQPRK
jgi:hypothetical protein